MSLNDNVSTVNLPENEVLIVYSDPQEGEDRKDAIDFINDECRKYEESGYTRFHSLKSFNMSMMKDNRNKDDKSVIVFHIDDNINGMTKLELLLLAETLREKSQGFRVLMSFTISGHTPLTYKKDNIDDALSQFLLMDNVTELSVHDSIKQFSLKD